MDNGLSKDAIYRIKQNINTVDPQFSNIDGSRRNITKS